MPEMTDSESRLRAGLHGLADPVRATDELDARVLDLDGAGPARASVLPRRRDARPLGQNGRRLGLVAAAAAVVLVVGGAVVVATQGDDGGAESVQATAPEGTTASTSVPIDLSSGTWSDIPAAPLSPRQGAATVWAGDRLVVWSGMACASAEVCRGEADLAASDRRIDGARWDPATGEWSEMAPPPGEVGLVPGGFAVWTGDEVIFGPTEPAARQTRATADYSPGLLAYDPSADSWRRVPSLSQDDGEPPAVSGGVGDGRSYWLAATGAGSVVLGLAAPMAADPADDSVLTGEASLLFFDPVTGRADEVQLTDVALPDDPSAYVRSVASAGPGVLVSTRGGLVFVDPGAGMVTLAAAPPSPSIPERTPTWTGDELVYALDGYGGGIEGGDRWAYRPATDTWRALAPTDLPVEPGPLPPFGDQAANASVGQLPGEPSTAWTGADIVGLGAAYDPAADSWSEVPRPEDDPVQRAFYDLIAWTGQELLVFGGDRYECPAGSLCDVSLGADDLVGRRYRP